MRDGIAKRAQRVADDRPAGFARNMGEIPFRELRDGRGSNRPIGGAMSWASLRSDRPPDATTPVTGRQSGPGVA
jgi:hypothetical protein